MACPRAAPRITTNPAAQNRSQQSVLVRNAEAAGTRVLSFARLHAARAARQTLAKTMKMRIAILASCAVAASFVAGGVHAETLKPIQGGSIDLGTLAGIAYYTVEPEGYRLVATLGSDTPVRFVATLAPGQSVTLSTPRCSASWPWRYASCAEVTNCSLTTGRSCPKE